MGDEEKKDLPVEKEGVVFLIKMEHSSKPSGHRIQKLVEQTDLFSFLKENEVPENFCRKDKGSAIQMKFSCFPCRTVLESVDALRCHLTGNKHAANLLAPPPKEEYTLENGKWKLKKGQKRRHPEDLSKREKGKRNKLQRNIPILPQHTEEKFYETETYFDQGFRRIRPYYFTFVAHAKGRWVGRDLWGVFSKEFRSMDQDFFNRCLTAGLIKVNNKIVSDSYRIQNNDYIAHTVHRHELPVTDMKIQIIHEDEDVVVVDKPSSMPVHPCGRYRHNSVIFILAKEHGLKTLHTVHRLDRLTSGVLIFTKNAQKSRELELLISGRQVKKEYICRVSGEFPEHEVVCTEPLQVISYKIGVVIVHKEGKECRTVFKRLQYKDGQSIVACYPETGRMHQIRVHLQYLGFPISNDPLYNSDVFGPEKGKNGVIGKSQEELIADLIKKHTVDNWIKSEEFANSRISEDADIEDIGDSFVEPVDGDAEVNGDTSVTESDNRKESSKNDNVSSEVDENRDLANLHLGARTNEPTVIATKVNLDAKERTKDIISVINDDKSDLTGAVTKECDVKPLDEDALKKVGGSADEEFVDEHCLDCKRAYNDPPKETMLIYLHAMKYSGEGFEYSTDTPKWAVL